MTGISLKRDSRSRHAGLTIHALLTGILIAAVPAAGAETGPFTFGGDVRVRYESVELDPGDDIHRERFRARFALETVLTDSLNFNLRLATGDGSPVSTNLDFGESFTLDEINVDRAYFDWRINDSASLYAGKMKNPLYRPGGTALNWDSDLNPEGIAGSFERGESFGSLAVFRVADQGETDSRLFALQFGRQWNVAGAGALTAGLGYYDYQHVRSYTPFFRGKASGNTVDIEGNYLFDYDIVELFVEYAMRVRGVPVELFGDWVRNLEASREDRAFTVGVNIGRAEERGQFAVSWAWRDTDADALIGTFTDSDFGGGNTDSKGQVLGVEYALTDRLVAGGTLILSEFGHFAGQTREFDRVMLDLEFRF